MSAFTQGYTRVANTIFDRFMKELKPYSLKILEIIVRNTIGWDRDTCKISYSVFSEKYGIPKSSAQKGIKELQEKGLISVFKNGKFQMNTLRINKQKFNPSPSEIKKLKEEQPVIPVIPPEYPQNNLETKIAKLEAKIERLEGILNCLAGKLEYSSVIPVIPTEYPSDSSPLFQNKAVIPPEQHIKKTEKIKEGTGESSPMNEETKQGAPPFGLATLDQKNVSKVEEESVSLTSDNDRFLDECIEEFFQSYSPKSAERTNTDSVSSIGQFCVPKNDEFVSDIDLILRLYPEELVS